MTEQGNRTVCLFGAAPDTGNHGVSALCYSAMDALIGASPGVRVVVFDHGHGLRAAERAGYHYQRLGAVSGRRYYQTRNLSHICASARLGPLGAAVNPAVRAIDRSDAVLDVSGGDSFTDLYGARRFWVVTKPKLITLARRRPLILLPQTYGPFEDEGLRSVAAKAVRGASMAWARDKRSYETLRELLGDLFDPAIHRCGVDMAFGLRTDEPGRNLPEPLDGWFDGKTPGAPPGDRPIVGFNVSGLIYLERDDAADYGLVADYKAAVHRFLSKILKETDARVVLIPHVMAPEGHYESDPEACSLVARAMSEHGDRVAVAPSWLDAGEVKWLIGRCDWFCGTRMHSTIAALSSGVSTASIAYSGKTVGVFETCGLGDRVADPRTLGTEQVIEHLWMSWERRAEGHRTLAERLPGVRETAREQMELIAARALGRSSDAAAA